MSHRPVRLVERLGRAMRFSPDGRAVRMWVEGAPGGDETRVVGGTIAALRPDGVAVVDLEQPARAGERELRQLLARPREPGWGWEALWFSFIAVDVFDSEDAAAPGACSHASAPEDLAAPAQRAPLAHWFIRLR